MFTDYPETIKLNRAGKRAISETRKNWKPGDEIWSDDLRTMIQVGDIGVTVDFFPGKIRHDSLCKCVNYWQDKTAKEIIKEIERG